MNDGRIHSAAVHTANRRAEADHYFVRTAEQQRWRGEEHLAVNDNSLLSPSTAHLYFPPEAIRIHFSPYAWIFAGLIGCLQLLLACLAALCHSFNSHPNNFNFPLLRSLQTRRDNPDNSPTPAIDSHRGPRNNWPCLETQ